VTKLFLSFSIYSKIRKQTEAQQLAFSVKNHD